MAKKKTVEEPIEEIIEEVVEILEVKEVIDEPIIESEDKADTNEVEPITVEETSIADASTEPRAEEVAGALTSGCECGVGIRIVRNRLGKFKVCPKCGAIKQ